MNDDVMRFVRESFPGLASEWAFFDNAGGSLTLARVADLVSDYLLHTNVQLGATYERSRMAAERVAGARERIARWIGAASAEEVVLGATSTLLLDTLARAMRERFEPGDEIVVTRAEHDANLEPWRRLEQDGAKLVFLDFDEQYTLTPDALRRVVSPRTRLVALTHVSNLFGTVHPLRELAEVAHRAGAEVVVDGVAYAPHRAVDVAAFGVDYYVFSLYKVYGPHHAVLWGRRDAMLALDPVSFVPRDRIPQKLEPGNVNYELTVGATGILDYLEELGRRASAATGESPIDSAAAITAAYAAIEAHEEAIGEPLLAWLRTRDDVRIIGASSMLDADRVPTISFVVKGRRSSDVVRAVERHRVAIRYGDFYARAPVDRLGLREQDGVVRVSMVHYNTPDEVDRVIAALDEALAEPLQSSSTP